MARCLIVGCGCHGLELADALRRDGHVVRGTTRRPERVAELEAAGVEGVLADPDRLATLVPALDHVGVVALLLGSVDGPPGQLEALHGPRLEALLVKLLDTTIRGVVYEAAGAVGEPHLASGAATVERVCAGSRVPYGLIEVARSSSGWLAGALDAIRGVLEAPL